MNMNIDIGHLFSELMKPAPARDWIIVLSLCALILLFGIGYGSYLFIGLRWGWVSGTSADLSAPQTPTVTAAQIEKVLTVYRMRRANFESGNYSAPAPQPAPAK